MVLKGGSVRLNSGKNFIKRPTPIKDVFLQNKTPSGKTFLNGFIEWDESKTGK